MSGITLQPMPVTNAAGTFNVSSDGYISGTAWPDAASRNKLRVGTIAAAVASLMYGGVGVAVALPPSGSIQGPQLSLAAGLAQLMGFAVFDQSAAGIKTPQNQVPLYSPGMALSFYEFGSGAAIALPISNANAAALLNGPENVQLSWDYTNQLLIPYTANGANAGAIPGDSAPGGIARILDVQVGNCWVPNPNSPSAGLVNWTKTGSCAVLQI
jgi:hypothetical protein